MVSGSLLELSSNLLFFQPNGLLSLHFLASFLLLKLLLSEYHLLLPSLLLHEPLLIELLAHHLSLHPERLLLHGLGHAE